MTRLSSVMMANLVWGKETAKMTFAGYFFLRVRVLASMR